MITIKLDVTKLEKKRFHHGKKGIYTDLALIEHPNDFGDDGFVVQSVSKEEHASGQRGPICGNWRELDKKPASKAEPFKPTPAKAPPPSPQRELIEDDDIPF
jgi:hypothetical protein